MVVISLTGLSAPGVPRRRERHSPLGLRLVLSAVTRAALPAHSRSPSAFHLLKVQIEQIF